MSVLSSPGHCQSRSEPHPNSWVASSPPEKLNGKKIPPKQDRRHRLKQWYKLVRSEPEFLTILINKSRYKQLLLFFSMKQSKQDVFYRFSFILTRRTKNLLLNCLKLILHHISEKKKL